MRSLGILLLLLPIGSLMTGCPPEGGPAISDTVTITYEQVGACNGYRRTTNVGGSGPQQTVSAGGSQAFLIFKIVSIDNSKSGRDFNFDPNRLYVVGTSPQAFMDSNLSLARDIGPLAATGRTIPKGQIVGLNGNTVTVISTSAVNGASEANKTSYMLGYGTTAGDPGVLFSKRNPTQTQWPNTEDCTLIIRF